MSTQIQGFKYIVRRAPYRLLGAGFLANLKHFSFFAPNARRARREVVIVFYNATFIFSPNDAPINPIRTLLSMNSGVFAVNEFGVPFIYSYSLYP